MYYNIYYDFCFIYQKIKKHSNVLYITCILCDYLVKKKYYTYQWIPFNIYICIYTHFSFFIFFLEFYIGHGSMEEYQPLQVVFARRSAPICLHYDVQKQECLMFWFNAELYCLLIRVFVNYIFTKLICINSNHHVVLQIDQFHFANQLFDETYFYRRNFMKFGIYEISNFVSCRYKNTSFAESLLWGMQKKVAWWQVDKRPLCLRQGRI